MPRPDVSETRKAQILDAATSVFARLGFHQARMDDIAQEAGLSKGALYLYYKSKDAIIFAILRVMFSMALRDLRAMEQSTAPVAEQLTRIAAYFAREMERMAPLQPIAFEFYAVAARHSGVRKYFREYFGTFNGVLTAIIRRGIESGEFRPGVDSHAAAIAFSALFEGLALLWMVDPQNVDPARESERAIDLLLDGLRVR